MDKSKMREVFDTFKSMISLAEENLPKDDLPKDDEEPKKAKNGELWFRNDSYWIAWKNVMQRVDMSFIRSSETLLQLVDAASPTPIEVKEHCSGLEYEPIDGERGWIFVASDAADFFRQNISSKINEIIQNDKDFADFLKNSLDMSRLTRNLK